MEEETKEKRSPWYDFIRALFWVGFGIALSTYFGTTTITLNGNVITSRGMSWLSLLLIIPEIIRCVIVDIVKPIYGVLKK